MTTESLIWTLLPNGVDRETGDLQSTIFVTPRLHTGGTREPLDSFPTFRHWAAALDRLKFLAEIDGIGTCELTRDERGGSPDAATWDRLFGGDVFVDETEVRDLSDRRVHSFPADRIADEILSLYGQVAAQHATEHPSIHDPLLASLADDLGRIGDFPDEEERRLDSWFGQDDRGPQGRRGRVVPSGVARASRANAFILANRFYDRRLTDDRLRDAPASEIDPELVPPPPDLPGLDFHNYVAAFGDYGHLLRMLGLAIDVRMPSDPAFEGRRRYRVVVEGDPEPWMNDDTATPWMNYEWRDQRWFVPATRDDGRHDVRDGQLLLESEDWYRVHQIDIDGSALKATNTASTVARQIVVDKAQKETMAPTTASLPALRGAGLTVTRRNTAETVVGQFDHTRSHAQGELAGIRADLWADDVIRGYRWEAEKDGSGQFRSLVARVGTFAYRPETGGRTILKVPAEDEGFVKGSSTTSVPGDEDLYLHEAIASWSGWSMVTPRPGGGVTEDEELDGGQTPRERLGHRALDQGLPLETTFRAAPGSLPTLRFGHDYRLRARTVDLAANSLDSEVLDDEHASPSTRFLRWEPVPAPMLVPRRAFGEGESQLRMVIRSTAGMTVDDYLALARVQGLAPVTVTKLGYAATDERWVVPPKTSQQLAELHGVFDEAIGSGDPAKIQAAYDVAAREAGALPEEVAGATLETPYLPDVLSRGVRFNRFWLEPEYRRQDWPATGEAGGGGAGGAQWWDRQPFRIVLVEGPGPAPVTPAAAWELPVWSAADGTLTVPIAQAEMKTIRVSSAVDEADLELMGMYDLLRRATDDDDWWARRHEALESRNWLLTPWVELTIVHAVEKPLADPVIGVTSAGMNRGSGETFCALGGTIAVHAKSTGRLDIEARWTQQVDDVLADAPDDGVDGRPALTERLGHAGDFLLEATEDACRVGRDDAAAVGVARDPGAVGPTHRLRHEFGDTKHRTVTYSATATTRFREYFPPEVTDGFEDVDGIRTSLIKRTGPDATLSVPSSRRPDPPDVAYVIPTFRWEADLLAGGGVRGGLGRKRTRHCGLRVYLRRPWYSSGDDERLGVVLTDQPWLTWPIDVKLGMTVEAVDRLRAEEFATRVIEAGAVKTGRRGTPLERVLRAGGLTETQVAGDAGEAELRVAMSDAMGRIGDVVLDPVLKWPPAPQRDPDTLITKIGADPAFASRSASNGPYVASFPLRTGVRGGVSLEETSAAPVTVVAHTPHFDASRRLWYCDIEVDGGVAYQPFVRLALCRYQANSIAGHHISKVVMADFAQILPRRVATLRPMARGLRVGLSGPVGVGTLGGTSVTPQSIRASRLVTCEIERLADGDDPDLDWVRSSDPVELAATVGEAGLGDVAWSAMVSEPERREGFSYRLLIKEYEIHPTDVGDTEDPFDAVRETEMLFFSAAVRQRLVYADSFPL
ncbi:hypothetical protein [Knoellia subterranea]|uniref:Uncharacterized protein n=1 Tax=Knoellia subterranea KCTC 19937 TaxID=1385521 RepID=A0A0A0JNH7_9MICO|nr:hypothetical protein [Knoellia subterranea]KGN37587.1 hypothetical protein N803_14020 [Knoellia subterranea KCTC 19937]